LVNNFYSCKLFYSSVKKFLSRIFLSFFDKKVKAWRGRAGRGMARIGKAGLGKAWPGEAWSPGLAGTFFNKQGDLNEISKCKDCRSKANIVSRI
jgi:hypothetical protein